MKPQINCPGDCLLGMAVKTSLIVGGRGGCRVGGSQMALTAIRVVMTCRELVLGAKRYTWNVSGAQYNDEGAELQILHGGLYLQEADQSPEEGGGLSGYCWAISSNVVEFWTLSLLQ